MSHTADTAPWTPEVQRALIDTIRRNLERVTGQVQSVHKHVPDEDKPFYKGVLDGLDTQYERLKARR